MRKERGNRWWSPQRVFTFTMGLKKVCPRNPELNPVVTCITPHASHNHLANTEKKKTHIMSCYIQHACHTSHSQKTPKVQNSSSKFKITHCHMGPKSQERKRLLVKICSSHVLAILSCFWESHPSIVCIHAGTR